MGRGTAKLEYDAMRVSMEEARERFRECWEVTQIGLKGEAFTYNGQYIKLERPIQIRPRLEPNRRIEFFGAIGSPGSAKFMTELGKMFSPNMRKKNTGSSHPDLLLTKMKCFGLDNDRIMLASCR